MILKSSVLRDCKLGRPEYSLRVTVWGNRVDVSSRLGILVSDSSRIYHHVRKHKQGILDARLQRYVGQTLSRTAALLICLL